MNIDILLRRYNTIRTAWTNSRTPEEEQEWYDKLQIIEKEIKNFKARKGSSELGSSVMSKYIEMNKNKAQKATDIKNTMEDNYA